MTAVDEQTAPPGPDEAPKQGPSTARRARVPSILQMAAVECGAASLGMVLASYGRWVSLDELRTACGVSRDGAGAMDLVHAAATYGLEGEGHRGTTDDLDGLAVPAIIWWRRSHFMVLEGIKGGHFFVNDPARGAYALTREEFDGGYSGAAITFTRTDAFEQGGRPYRVMAALWQRLRHSRTGAVYAVLAGLLAMVLGLVPAPINQAFVNQVLAAGRKDEVRDLVVALLAVGLLRAALTALEYATLVRIQTKLSLVYGTGFVERLLRLPVQFYMQRSVGDLTQRVGYNVTVAQIVASQLAASGIAMIGVAAYGALLFYYSWQLGLVVIGLSALNVVVLRFFHNRSTAQARVLRAQGKVQGTTVSAIQSIETMKATGTEDDVFRTLTGQQARYLSALNDTVVSTAVVAAVPTVLFSLTLASIVLVGGLLILDGGLTVGGLLAVQALAAGINAPIQTLMGASTQMQTVTSSLQSLDDVLGNDLDPRYVDRTATGTADVDGSLTLEGVTFGYSITKPPLIDGFDLDLRPGRRVALVGGSGSGKSTIANVAAGILTPWSGRVLFGGHEVGDLAPGVIERSLSKVDQTIVLFEGTVRQNVTLWDDTIPEAQVRRALDHAQILADVLARPGGIDTFVDEGGRNFSGGQRQRLEIARALVLDPRILILDEATSALDSATEQLVDEALRERGVSCLIVAHRLSTIRDADEIVVLGRGGTVLERGSHEELLAAGGEYAGLVNDAGEGGDVGT